MQEGRTVLAIISVTGEPVAMKVARRVRGGGVEKGHSMYLVGVLLYHWAHEKREDGSHSPAEVLGWQKGAMYPETVLDRILFATRYTRYLDKHGFLRFSNWKLYGERGLAHQPVSVWVYEGTLKIEHQAITLSKYTVELQEDHRHLREVSHPRVAETPFRSPQLMLIDLSPDEWVLYWRMPPSTKHRRRHVQGIEQMYLFELPPVEKAVGVEGTHQELQAYPLLRLVPKTLTDRPEK